MSGLVREEVLKTAELKNDRDLDHASNRSSDRLRCKTQNKCTTYAIITNELFIMRASSCAIRINCTICARIAKELFILRAWPAQSSAGAISGRLCSTKIG